MENRKGYKKTKLGWIPEDWEALKLGEICEVKRGASPRPIKDPKWFGGNVGWVRISDVTASKKYLNYTKDYLSDEGVNKSVRIKKGEIIMSICATIGVPIIMNMDACIHDGFVWFERLPESIDREFFYYFLLFNSNKIASNRQIGTQGNLNTNIVSSFYFPLMEIVEQRKIAAILSTVDEKIAAIDEQLAEAEQLKKGLMRRLLTKGIGHTEFKETKIGKIPKEWEVGGFSNIVENNKNAIKPGPFGSSLKKEYYVQKGYKVYGQEQVIGADLSIGNYYVDEIKFKELENFQIKENDILISLVGTVGKVLIVPKHFEKGIINPRLIKISVDKDKACYKFTAYLLTSEIIKNQITTLGQGGTMAVLSGKTIKALIIPIPPVSEQRIIANIFNSMDEKLDVLREKKGESQILKKGLMQKLLTGDIRVKTKGEKR